VDRIHLIKPPLMIQFLKERRLLGVVLRCVLNVLI
jgi:hypothetical protein